MGGLSMLASNAELPRRLATLGLLGLVGLVGGLVVLRFSPEKVLIAALGLGFIAFAVKRIDAPFLLLVLLVIVLQETESAKGSLFSYLSMENRGKLPHLLEWGACALLVAFAMHYFFWRKPLFLSPISLPFAAFLFLIGLSLVVGLVQGNDPVILKQDFKKFLFPILFFICAINILDSEKRIRVLLIAVFTLSAVKSAVGILYYLAGLGFAYEDNSVIFVETADNLLLVTCIVAAASLVISRALRPTRLLFLCAAVLPMIFSLLFSYRRNAWLGVLLSLLLLACLAPRRQRIRIAAVGAASLILLTLFVSIAGTSRSLVSDRFLKDRLFSITDRGESSNTAHMIEWEITTRETMRQPVLGLGLGSKHSPVPGIEGMPTHTVHNAFLMLWMKMGIIPVGFFLWWLLRYVRFGIRAAQIEDDTSLKAIQRALFATLGYWAVSLNVGPTWHYYRETFLMALVVALVIRLASLKPVSSLVPSGVPRPGVN